MSPDVPLLRVATPDDGPAVAAIYAPYVRETTISFESEPPGDAEMSGRIAVVGARYPWLVVESGGTVVGYAYGSEHRSRPAYRWSVDVSVYVDRTARRGGHGRRLYLALLDLLRAQGYVNAFAGIALPNDASVGLHEAMGFTPVGVYREVGHKGGQWHDVGWWQLRLGEPGAEPGEPRPLRDVPGGVVAGVLGTSTS